MITMGNFLYNGIELPALPNWNKETHPYAVISRYPYSGAYVLWVMQNLDVVILNRTQDGTQKYNCINYHPGDLEYRYEYYSNPSNGWGEPEIMQSSLGFGFNNIIWTNTDLVALMEENGVAAGEVYLAASEPVPVHSYQEWIIAADETGDTVLQNGYTKPTGSEWYIYSEATSATELAADNMVWTNTTLNNTDGSVYLESSKGIWLINLKDFLSGLGIGLACDPRYNPVKTPIAYLYNGVQLPPLPEWDKSIYPYAYITKNLGISIPHYLVLKEKPLRHYFEESLGGASYEVVGSEPCKTINIMLLDSGEWEDEADWEYDENDDSDIFGDTCWLWASHDILKEDGTVHLAASDPIPVYE